MGNHFGKLEKCKRLKPKTAWKKDTKVQLPSFLHVAGEEALEEFNTFSTANMDEQQNLAAVMEKFETKYNLKKNLM